jgi:hypothetical protein
MSQLASRRKNRILTDDNAPVESLIEQLISSQKDRAVHPLSQAGTRQKRKHRIQGVTFPFQFSFGEEYDILVKLSKEKSWRNRSRKEGVMKITKAILVLLICLGLAGCASDGGGKIPTGPGGQPDICGCHSTYSPGWYGKR